jgi:hypothetical protein
VSAVQRPAMNAWNQAAANSTIFLRLALGISFLSAVSDRLG